MRPATLRAAIALVAGGASDAAGGTSDEAGTSSDPSPDESVGTAYPHLAEVAAHAVGATFSFDAEFQHGQEVIMGAIGPAPESSIG